MPRIKHICLWLVAAGGLLPVCGLRAETLQDALVEAYRSNPDLEAQRAKLRGTDEAFIQARAEFAATLSLQTQATYNRDTYGREARLQAQTLSPGSKPYSERTGINPMLVVTQPLFTSGRISADIKAAGAQVSADRQGLRIVEAAVLFDVIQAYADVVRDQKALDIRKLNLEMLTRQLAETRAMQKAGEITRTDVAQIEAALATEEDLNSQAAAQLEISRANFAAAVGHAPEDLAPMPELGGELGSLSEVAAVAEAGNPSIRRAVYIEEASHARIYAAKASQGINVDAQLQGGYDGSLSPFQQRNLDRVVGVTVNVTVPLYSGGRLRSQTRQAFENNTADRMNAESVHRGVIKSLVTSWQQWNASQQSTKLQDRAVKSAAVAYVGMGKEYRVGERSTLDVLQAEETQRNAEIALNAARHDEFVSKAAILQIMGRLEITNLAAVDHPYNPDAHLKAVAPKIGAVLSAPVKAIDGLSAGSVKPMVLSPAPGLGTPAPSERKVE